MNAQSSPPGISHLFATLLDLKALFRFCGAPSTLVNNIHKRNENKAFFDSVFKMSYTASAF